MSALLLFTLFHRHPHRLSAPLSRRGRSWEGTRRKHICLSGTGEFDRLVFSPPRVWTDFLLERVSRSRLQPPRDELCSLRLWVLFIIQSLSNAVLPSAEVSVLARHKRACSMWKSELDQLKLGGNSPRVKVRLNGRLLPVPMPTYTYRNCS